MATHFKFVRMTHFERVLQYAQQKEIYTENDMFSPDLYVFSESDIASVMHFCLEQNIPHSVSCMSEKKTPKWCSEGHWVGAGDRRVKLTCHHGMICLTCARRHSNAIGHFSVRSLTCCSLCHKNKWVYTQNEIIFFWYLHGLTTKKFNPIRSR